MKTIPVKDATVGDVVQVIWDDAFWQPGSTIPEDWGVECLMVTFGMVCRNTKKGISIAHEFGDNGIFRGVTHVPKKYVVNVKLFGKSTVNFNGK